MKMRNVLALTALACLGLVNPVFGEGEVSSFDAVTAARSEAEAQEAQRAWAKRTGVEVVSTNSIGMKMRLIPPGEFLMGSPAGEAQRRDDEVQHRVRISKSFLMGIHEVTQAQWQAVMGNNPSYFKGDNLPMEQVSWDEAVEFCKRLSQKEGKTYRLPTEAEWEYACRAGTRTAFAWGNEADGGKGWANAADQSAKRRFNDWVVFNWDDGQVHTAPVGSYHANAWGLYDMHGNVWEWCADWYGEYPTDQITDPTGPASGRFRVVRGGSWNFGPGHCRAAVRVRDTPGCRYSSFGFRVVLNLAD